MPPRKRGIKMKEEINLFKYTQKDLIGLLKKQREEYALEEYFNIEDNLLNKIKRTLDLRDLKKSATFNLRKTRKSINKLILIHFLNLFLMLLRKKQNYVIPNVRMLLKSQ